LPPPPAAAADRIRPDWLPKGVHEHNGRYRKSVRVDGKQRWVSLSRVEEGRKAFEAALRKYESDHARDDDRPGSVRDLVYRYLRDCDLAARDDDPEALADSTRRGYWAIADKSPLLEVFGRARIEDVQPEDVVDYLKARKRAKAPIAGNRERALLSCAFSYAKSQKWMRVNPCFGVRRNHEGSKFRNVRTEELDAVLAKLPEHLRDVVEFAYLTGLRKADILGLKRSNLDKEYVSVVEGKTRRRTGKMASVRWSDRLRACVQRALDRQERIASKPASKSLHRQSRPPIDFVFANSRNQPLTSSAVDSALKRLGSLKTFAFHDLRAKGHTDAEAKNRQNLLGHTAQMSAKYLYSRVVDPVE
jgi:integrase